MKPHAPTVVVTQGEGVDGPLAASLAARGAKVLALPTVSIVPPEDFGPLDRAISEIERYDWIVFTSRHAVEAVCTRPGWQAARGKELPTLRVAAVGKATAAHLFRFGVTPDLLPEEAGASGLARLLASNGASRLAKDGDRDRPLDGVRVLWPRSDIARRELSETLKQAGAQVTEPVAYRTLRSSGQNLDEFLARLESGTIDAITFMSPSSARNLSALLGRSDLSLLAARTAVASIGPTTSDALRELGVPPDIESAARTAEDLAATVISFLESRLS